MVPVAVDVEVSELSILEAGFVVVRMSWGKSTFSVMACPPILYLVSVFQFLSIEGVRGCRWGGKSKEGATWILLDLSELLHVSLQIQ